MLQNCQELTQIYLQGNQLTNINILKNIPYLHTLTLHESNNATNPICINKKKYYLSIKNLRDVGISLNFIDSLTFHDFYLQYKEKDVTIGTKKAKKLKEDDFAQKKKKKKRLLQKNNNKKSSKYQNQLFQL